VARSLTYRQGDVLCKKGDVANEMFLTVSGKLLVTELAIELPPGSPVGEIGFLTSNNRRTATVECTEAARVLTITYEVLPKSAIRLLFSRGN
jgi:CRP-like cAMP-binding protein